MKTSVLAVVILTLLASFTSYQATPTYQLTLSPQQAQTLLYVIEKSTAEHNVVAELQKAVLTQFQEQTAAMQKAAADTTKPKGKN